ncbi:MAG: phosphotransferase [Phycisphaeraceae bacterium]|nr:MAG: phosphotransferase [Phycisphaeraceae bacterium]
MTRRERFDSRELAIVLSHYELGVIESIRDYPRGSRRAPKVRIRTQTGEYLLKRRAPGRDEPHRVAFSHRLQLHLAENSFPVARLIGTRDSNNSLVQHEGAVYEMFEYVRGEHFNGSNRATQYAGYALAHLHRLLGGHALVSNPPDASYHAAPGLAGHVAAVPRAVSTVDVKASEADLLRCCAYLREAYDDAVRRVESLGYSRWPRVINHGDWHPGNLLFHPDRRVAAVIDFDSARLEPRMTDVANGALQFSMRIGQNTEDPTTWPEALSAERIRAFVRGYDQGAATPLTDAEHQSLPWLIIEALIAESVVPIAATGSFARIPGAPFLAMIERKVRWLTPRAERLVTFVRESQR